MTFWQVLFFGWVRKVYAAPPTAKTGREYKTYLKNRAAAIFIAVAVSVGVDELGTGGWRVVIASLPPLFIARVMCTRYPTYGRRGFWDEILPLPYV